MIYSIAVRSKNGSKSTIKIYYLEISQENPDIDLLAQRLFHNPLTEELVAELPQNNITIVMRNNAVLDSAQQSIISGCRRLGVEVEAAKVAYCYIGEVPASVFINPLIHVKYHKVPKLETLKPRGSKIPMEVFDLRELRDDELVTMSEDKDLQLSLPQMRELVQIQMDLDSGSVSDVFLDIFAARWSDHCKHTTWASCGLLDMLKRATELINNPNLVSAYYDNAGGWAFYENLVLCISIETHNSPTGKEPYGGQITKLLGDLRDIFEFGLGAKPIGALELTVIGELTRKKFPEIADFTLDAGIIARETVRAIADAGDPMGVPMMLAWMDSHPGYSGKPFALGGAIGITTTEAAQKGVPRIGDYAVVLNWTGNDGYHGATVSSGGLTEKTDTGDANHVQMGDTFPEQKLMRARLELRDAGCLSAGNDFGAAGFTAFIEIGEATKRGSGYAGGIKLNFGLVLLKCAGLPDKIIAVGESQERFAHVVKPEKLKEAMAIYCKYELMATVVGIFTGNNRVQIFNDSEATKLTVDMPLTGVVSMDVPYEMFDRCPLPTAKPVAPPTVSPTVVFPVIDQGNVEDMTIRVVGSFGLANQTWATTQYDSTVQGITRQGPLYGKDYNIPSSLSVLRPVEGKDWGATLSSSFAPWQFDVDPVAASFNAVVDAVARQVMAGVKMEDICLADNFYTPDKDPYALWYLCEQVKLLAQTSIELGIPFGTGKDSSHGSGEYNGVIVNIPPGVCVTAMGKIIDVHKITPHTWKAPGNLLYFIGYQAQTLKGSILASELDLIEKDQIDTMPIDEVSLFYRGVEAFAQNGDFVSAVPVNRGGLVQKLFEGIQASGFGVKTNLLAELFPESFGAALVEVSPKIADMVEHYFKSQVALVGEITADPEMEIQGTKLDMNKLFNAWNSGFSGKVVV
ncbi:MAG: AIR synthase-related protein [Patescibacteria group bacterium]|nr:AIR synthase-related protein [Patescibacteria group bacterium]